ncbi:elongation factor P 5-aminopentanone reductase [Halobacillus seohaensis]
MNKRCLIIGGSGDIGSRIVEKVAASNIDVAVHYRTNKDKNSDIQANIPQSRWLGSYYGDLSSEEGIEEFIDSMPKDWDMLVFAPGNHSTQLFQDITSEQMDEYYFIHVKAMWMITRALLPTMIQNKQGKIVVVSSLWGEEGASMEVLYSTVKGAQISFVKALAKEVAPSGIRVNAVTPGFISTKMNHQLSSGETNSIFEEIPLGRAGTSEEVANGVAFLLGDQSSYITGHILRINGGWF